MPLFDTVVLTLIVAIFITFGVLLAGSWYCRDTAMRDTHRHGAQASSIGLIADDD